MWITAVVAIGILLVASVLFIINLSRRCRALNRRLAINPFELDMEKLTTQLKIKRGGTKVCVEASLLQILDCIAGEGKSMEHMADDLSKVLALEDEQKITDNEMRIILLYVAPTIVDFHSSLKKALPFG